MKFVPERLEVAVGDRILVVDAGSYDHSMAFEFARGTVR